MRPRQPAPRSPEDLLASLASRKVASHIWWRHPSIFLPAMAPPAPQVAIKSRLGWLDAPDDGARLVAELDMFAAGVRRDGLTDVYLLGMGGSSLAAEVLRDAGKRRSGGARLTVVDTTDETTIRDVSERFAAERTLFVVASKSGTTVEVTALERHFWNTLTRRRGGGAGAQFVAVTDPDTPLAALAAERRYRRLFLNRADIGGRYSALSLFGLVPAALLGLDLRELVASGQRMAASCRLDATSNPGLALGAFLAAAAAAGHDKLTMLASPALESLGAWIEQLVAESTGKEGRGVLPIVGEPPGAPDEYGPDRAFVALISPDDEATAAAAERLEAAGRRVLRAPVEPSELGAEFFRWEFATAVLGASLVINPFDEPNVREAKTRTSAQLDHRKATGTFRIDPPLQPREGWFMRVSRAVRPRPSAGRYLAVLDYLPGDPARMGVIAGFRADHRRATGQATSYGVGPRYLHSTGQYHKGGPATGRFVLLTGADPMRTAVPGEAYSFSSLKYAQALGDFEALVAADRDVVHCHFEAPAAGVADVIRRAVKALDEP